MFLNLHRLLITIEIRVVDTSSRNSHRWFIKLGIHFFNRIVFNAFIVYQEYDLVKTKKSDAIYDDDPVSLFTSFAVSEQVILPQCHWYDNERR